MKTVHVRSLSLVRSVALLTILFVAAISAQAASPGARLISVSGTAEILAAPSAQWVSATSPAVLPYGAALRTGPNSKVVLELDGAVVTLYDTSLIRIPAAAAPASTADNPLRNPSLDSGRALFDVTPRAKPAPFSVRTPTIVAGVKGTVFEVVAIGTEQSVYVWRGLVEVSSLIDRADVQLVSAGRFTTLDNLHLTTPIDIPSDREEPTGIDSHQPSTASTVTTASAATADTATFREATEGTRDVLPAQDSSALTVERDPLMDLWLEADSMALQGALDDARDFQSVVSTGAFRTVRTAISTTTSTTDSVTSSITDPNSTGSTLSTTTDPVVSTLSTTTQTLVSDPVSGTLSLVTDPVSSTVSTLTSTVDSTLTSTTSTLSSTLEPIVTDTTSTVVSTVSSPLGLLGF